jgi:DNA-binding NtrC family response regulator
VAADGKAARASVLVVDDDRAVGTVLAALLTQAGHEARAVGSGAEALAALASRSIDVVISDVRMPGMDGLELLAEVRKRAAGVPVILLTAHGNVPLAVEAMRAGAADFLLKPFDRDEVLFAVEKGARKSDAASRRPPAPANGVESGVVIGSSRAIRDAMDRLAKAAPTTATVLLRGESGTGKEVAARELHRQSGRTGPFVAVHCAALPESLLESELFGHEKGAFTGAIQRKPGRVELARGGTLMLDEIGDVPLPMQAKLLRVIQEREYTPLGSTRSEKADVRFVAATHRDLDAMVARGEFREDLFFRLNVVPVRMPSLAERQGDVEVLAARFVSLHGANNGKPALRITPGALAALREARWPGNVRELSNFVERLVVFADETEIDETFVRTELAARTSSEPSDLTSSEMAKLTPSTITSLETRRNDAERDALRAALQRTNGNRTQAARLLGVSRRTLYNKLAELELGSE